MFRLNRNKQKTNQNSMIGSIFCYFLQKIQGFSGFSVFSFFCVFFVFFVFFQFVSKQFVSVVSTFYTEIESFDVSIEPKQTEDPPKQFKREYIWVFFRKFRVVSVCFGLLRNRSVCFGCFNIGSKHRNKPKFFAFGFTKQTETNAKQILFRFVSVRTEIYFCLFRGHPSPSGSQRRETLPVKARVEKQVQAKVRGEKQSKRKLLQSKETVQAKIPVEQRNSPSESQRREIVQVEVRGEKQSERKLQQRNSPSESQRRETVQAKVIEEKQSKRK